MPPISPEAMASMPRLSAEAWAAEEFAAFVRDNISVSIGDAIDAAQLPAAAVLQLTDADLHRPVAQGGLGIDAREERLADFLQLLRHMRGGHGRSAKGSAGSTKGSSAAGGAGAGAGAGSGSSDGEGSRGRRRSGRQRRGSGKFLRSAGTAARPGSGGRHHPSSSKDAVMVRAARKSLLDFALKEIGEPWRSNAPIHAAVPDIRQQKLVSVGMASLCLHCPAHRHSLTHRL